MGNTTNRRSLTSKVGLLYFFMNVISIALFTWVITNNQVELITDNTRYQARDLMSTVVHDLSSLPVVQRGDSSQAIILKEMEGALIRVVPNYTIFKGSTILAASPATATLPADALRNAMKAESLRDQSGVDYHLVLDKKMEKLDFYVPLKNLGLPATTLYTSLALTEIGRRFRDLYQLLGVTVLALTLLHAGFGILIYRLVITPILELHDATRKVAAGDFSQKVKSRRFDEIGALAEGFNYMMGVVQDTLGRMERMAVTDELTGLRNRRYFFEKIEESVANSQRYGQNLGLMLLDIDYFKKINDNFGHVAGDQVLRAISACLVANSRKTDIVARYGGEELIVLLPSTDLAGTRLAAEKVRQAMEDLRILVDNGRELNITTSVGIVEYQSLLKQSENTVSVTVFVEAADGALYQAKRNGRNRVEVAG